MTAGITLGAGLIALQLARATATQFLKVLSQKTVDSTGHIETVGYDAANRVFYLSNFDPALKPVGKD